MAQQTPVKLSEDLLLLLSQKKKYEAKGLAIQKLENSSVRTPLEILRTVRTLVFIALGLDEPLLQLMPVLDFQAKWQLDERERQGWLC